MDSISKYVKRYDPERDASRHEKFNEHFLSVIPESTVSYAGKQIFIEYFAKNVLPESYTAVCQAFEALLEKFPILSRIIIYTYSPAEDLDTRIKMLNIWNKIDEIRNDLKTARIMHDARFCCSIPKHPSAEISQFPVISEFLENRLAHDFYCVLYNDFRKISGEAGTVKELRDNWNIREERSSNTNKCLNCSPWYKIEIIEKKSGNTEFHYYLLHESMNVADVFLYADAHIVESFQLTNRFIDKVQVFIYGHDGELAKPPGKHTNPFAFNFIEKYYGIIASKANISIKNQWEDIHKAPGSTIILAKKKIESNATVALIKSAKEWKGDRSPVAHVNKYFDWRFKSATKKYMRGSREVFIKKNFQESNDNEKDINREERISVEQDAFKNPRNLQNVADDIPNTQALSIDLRKALKKIKSKASTPSQKVIIQNLMEIFEGKPELTPKQLQERILKESGQKISEAGVRQAESRVKKDLRNLLKTEDQ